MALAIALFSVIPWLAQLNAFQSMSFTPLLQKLQRLCFIGVIGLLLTLNWQIQPTLAASLSPVKGLMALKTMAKQSLPYDLAMANEKPTVLEFYADWCGSCQSMAPVVTELHEHYGDRINFVMVNIDDAQAATTVKQYAVTGIPHLVTLTANGEITDEFIGRVPGKLLDSAIAPLVAEPEEIAQSLSIPNLS